ncbi:MAG: hypothetical protein ACXVZM_10155 [Terriglobales bacterium]
MKRIMQIVAAALALISGVAIYAGAQESLGELARQQRQSKKPSSAKLYTNDDLAMAPEAPAAAAADKTEKSDKAEAGAPKAGAADDKAKLAAAFKARADEQKKNIAQLERELDVAQREYRLKVAVYYADAGNNLRDGKKWAEDDRKQRTEIEGKQKAVADAKQKLADLQEEARKAGIRID